MTRIPAVCNKCGQIFPTGLVVGGSATVQMKNCAAGPCPYCGSTGSILDGIYSALMETALLFTSGSVLPSHIRYFLNIAKSSIKHRVDTERVSADLEKNVPELSSIADVLPKTRNELYLFLGILIALATLILNTCGSEDDPLNVSETNINIIVNQAIDSVYSQQSRSEDLDSEVNKNVTRTKSTIKEKAKRRRKITRESRRKNRKR